MRFIVLQYLPGGMWVVQLCTEVEFAAVTRAKAFAAEHPTFIVDTKEERTYRVPSPETIKEN